MVEPESIKPIGRRSREIDRKDEGRISFSFADHRRIAVEKYLRVRPQYEAFALAVKEIVVRALTAKKAAVNSVEARAKDPDSFGNKAVVQSVVDPGAPKYPNPLHDISDLAGVRVIAFFPRTVEEVGDCIREEFVVVEHTDHSRTLRQEERFGYQSEHYLVQLDSKRTRLPEYQAHLGLVAEIQVRTILQHAWAEIEHDIQYKSSITIPDTIRRRFMALAGVLEIADREFQAIQDEDKLLKERSKMSIATGSLDNVEITGDALRPYVDKKVGADANASDFSYEYMARVLRRMGFVTFGQIDACIEGYDGDQLGRIRWKRQPVPINRFEEMLLVGMGQVFIERRTHDTGRKEFLRRSLARYQGHGIATRDYDPLVRVGSEVNG